MIVAKKGSSRVDFPRTKEAMRGKSKKEIIEICRSYVRQVCPELEADGVERQVRLLANPILLDNGYRVMQIWD